MRNPSGLSTLSGALTLRLNKNKTDSPLNSGCIFLVFCHLKYFSYFCSFSFHKVFISCLQFHLNIGLLMPFHLQLDLIIQTTENVSGTEMSKEFSSQSFSFR